MTSLPISSNKPQASGNAANALQANIATDTPTTDTASAEPFAFLLARQISETALSASDTAQTTIDGNAMNSSADHPLKDAQDQTAAVANIPSGPANTLAAILQQIPVPEDRGQKADGMQATQPFALGPFQRTESRQAIQPLALGPFQKTEGRQAMQLAPGSSQEIGHKKPVAGPEDSQITQLPTIDHLPSEAVKRADLPSALAQSTPNPAQAIASPAISAAMPGMLTNNMPASTSQTITTPLGKNGWADEFSQKISWISTQQNQVAELHLNPPNLGPLDVVLKISDNQATALFTSPHGAVRDAVENALPKLREILADNGVMLGNTTISDQSPRDRNMDGFMSQGSGTAVRHEAFDIASEPDGLVPVSAQTALARRHNGMVDTFA